MGATAIPIRQLRRISLDRQGLLRRSAFGSGLAGTRAAIERLGYVQIDTIAVVSRAHDHVLQVRVPDYRPEHLQGLLAAGSIFEYWAHAAAYLPMRDYRFALPRMQAMRARQERWVRSHDDALMERVLQRVRQDGPLQARDFEADPAAPRAGGWWQWKPAKRALEQLFMQGDLMIVGRSGFQKIYDLTERVLPAWVDDRLPSLQEYAAYLVRQQLDAHGFASVRACSYQRPTPGLKGAVALQLEEARRHGGLTVVALPADGVPGESVYVAPEALDGRLPAAPIHARILSPFDNVIIQRRSGQSLFGYDYQLECYLPEHKRRFGYFCLPILYRDRFIGRVDCKAHRQQRRLEIRRLFVEHPQWLLPDGERGVTALATALTVLARANHCPHVDLGEVHPADWQQSLAAACHQMESTNS